MSSSCTSLSDFEEDSWIGWPTFALHCQRDAAYEPTKQVPFAALDSYLGHFHKSLNLYFESVTFCVTIGVFLFSAIFLCFSFFISIFPGIVFSFLCFVAFFCNEAQLWLQRMPKK